MSSTHEQHITANFYNAHAAKLAAQYDSKSFKEVHASWFHHLADIFVSHVKSNQSPLLASLSEKARLTNMRDNVQVNVLDIGAGSGRDVKYLAEQGALNQTVAAYAIEPAVELAAIGKRVTQNLNVTWLEDSLPELNALAKLDALAKTDALVTTRLRFNLILLSAVWMHIPALERLQSLNRLTQLLEPTGKLVITLRHGPSGDEREMHQVSIAELATMSAKVGLTIIDSVTAEQDKLGRAEVHWETVVLQRSTITKEPPTGEVVPLSDNANALLGENV
ncbi:class I SAM-dependent methyltransferase [Shewanella sp. 125m-7]